MSKKNLVIILGAIIILALTFLLGVTTGKKMVEPQIVTKTEYLPGKEIHDSIPIPEPYEVQIPTRIDSVGLFKYLLSCGKYEYLIPYHEHNTITYKDVDTMAIVKDFLTKNSYKVDLFDVDTLGKLTIYPEIQYNKLISPINYDFYPVVKTTTNTVIKRESRYLLGAGLGLKNTYSLQAGYMFKSGWAATLEYERLQDYNDNNFKINILKGF